MLRRHASTWLVVASLLALGLGQPFHAGPPPIGSGGSSVAASRPGSGAPPLPHDGAHLPGLCSLCRALAQTRMGVRTPAPDAAAEADTSSLPLPLARVDAPRATPARAPIEPRAPPGRPDPQTA